ncbi:type II toxin-antitoxin system HigB family toxin [Roseomonas sp. ACRSG]|nr:type II toxin-antitoxin system HigB family toxin [Roseomonas sp. ACRSG]
MEVVSFKILKKYFDRKGNEKAKKPLTDWFDIAKAAKWNSTVEVKETFPQTDFRPKGYAIFDIGGDKFRIVAKIDYPSQIVRIEEVFDHKEYDKWNK